MKVWKLVLSVMALCEFFWGRLLGFWVVDIPWLRLHVVLALLACKSAYYMHKHNLCLDILMHFDLLLLVDSLPSSWNAMSVTCCTDHSLSKFG